MPALHARHCIALLALLLLTGCGSSVLSFENGQLNANKQWQSWDPLAAPIQVPQVAAALAQCPATTLNGRRVMALNELNQPDTKVQQALVLRDNAGQMEIWATQALPFAGLYVQYDPQREHPVQLDVERPQALSMAMQDKPGLIEIGVTALNGARLDSRRPLAVLRFAPGPGSAITKQVRITQEARSKVRDLTAVSNGDGSATLQWSERNTGDYDLNSIVAIGDLARVGQNYGRSFTTSDADWAQVEVVDGNEDSQIGIGDLVPMGINWGSQIMGYNVYRTPLTTPTEIPDVTETARWTKVVNTANPAGPSAPRSWSGEKFRLVYTFIDDSGNGDFGWYVTPAGPEMDVPPEGPKSDPVTLTVSTLPTSGLSFEIQPPAGDTVNVNDEFYLAVKVAGVTGLFSANVRFEYDAALVQYEEGVASYTGSPANFLFPPLFLQHDYGVSSGTYNLIGFNATQQQGEPGKDGDGYLGFFKFKALAAGANTECFRFPQVSTYIYLWGIQYGVPIATPGLGPAQSLTIN